jgi:hypothetical protein
MNRKFLLASAALSACASSPTIASGRPLAIYLTPSTQTITEGQHATFTLTKSGGNGRAVVVKVTTSDGSFSANVAPGSSFAVPTVDDSLVNGSRTITVTAIASTGASARATITELDNDVAPLPPAPTPPPPTPTPSGWVAASLTNGGYARCKAVGGCHGFGLNPVGGFQGIIANQGDVLMYALNGCDSATPCRYIGAFWPQGQYRVAGIGAEGFVDEWEGVAPAP